MPVNPKIWLSYRTGSPRSTLWTKRLKLTQLAQNTLPIGRSRVNSVDLAKHVVPTAEYWRTGVQIPPAPPNSKTPTVLGWGFFLPDRASSRVLLRVSAEACGLRQPPDFTVPGHIPLSRGHSSPRTSGIGTKCATSVTGPHYRSIGYARTNQAVGLLGYWRRR